MVPFRLTNGCFNLKSEYSLNLNELLQLRWNFLFSIGRVMNVSLCWLLKRNSILMMFILYFAMWKYWFSEFRLNSFSKKFFTFIKMLLPYLKHNFLPFWIFLHNFHKCLLMKPSLLILIFFLFRWRSIWSLLCRPSRHSFISRFPAHTIMHLFINWSIVFVSWIRITIPNSNSYENRR